MKTNTCNSILPVPEPNEFGLGLLKPDTVSDYAKGDGTTGAEAGGKVSLLA